jgi:spore germination cell wall hydrolase CwlJ-like protein
MFSKLHVAVSATLILSSIGVALANSEPATTSEGRGAYEAPVIIKADEAVLLSDSMAAAGAAVVSPRPAVLHSAIAPQAALELDEADEAPATTLAAMVAGQDDDDALSSEEHCLATAIYYESRSESLAGQLAVGRVVVNRARSGRFPASLCGVVTQPGQFSFVRGGRLPEVGKNGAQWRNARAIAQIAIDDKWESPAEGALFFHASHVAPGWGKPRLARIDNHIFYR